MNQRLSSITYGAIQSLIEDLHSADKWLYGGEGTHPAEIYNILSPEAGEMLREYIEDNDVDPNDLAAIHKALRSLENDIQSREVVTIVTATHLSLDFLREIHHWFEKNFPIAIVLDNYVDRDILGGAMIWWRGIYIDLSLEEKLNIH